MSTASHLHADLKDEILLEARILRQVKRGVRTELERIARVTTKRRMPTDAALRYAKLQIADYFAAELAARKVSR